MLKKRYSELENFHKELVKKTKEFNIEVIIPSFPAKKLIGSTYNNDQDILYRKIDM